MKRFLQLATTVLLLIAMVLSMCTTLIGCDSSTDNPSTGGTNNGGSNNGGSGNGPSYDLGGRGAKSIAAPSKEFNEEGTIVVNIKVDREGRVVEVSIGLGTDIIDSSMRESALRAAKNSIFNKDENAPEIQSGTITYKFIKRQ